MSESYPRTEAIIQAGASIGSGLEAVAKAIEAHAVATTAGTAPTGAVYDDRVRKAKRALGLR